MDDLGDIRFGLNKYGADKSAIGISILDKDDGSCTLQIFDVAGKALRLVLISINCRWDDDAFRRFESAVSEWNQKEKEEPLLSALEQQMLF
ncbi:hypothetical protein NF212_12690 [Parasalinivibrio latis]|uniref:hypothetical protein n=1 Tax=Parasalinivibrio latis TaxID=2952610 RepID=UPI0030E503C8